MVDEQVKRIRRLLEAMAEDTFNLSDEEIEEEIRAGGEDPVEIAARMRARTEALLREMSMPRMPVVYVAAPFTAPTLYETHQWVQRTTAWSRLLIEMNVAPLVPHKAYGIEFIGLKTPEFWYDATLGLLKVSDAVVVIASHRDDGTPSKGVAGEVAAAENMPLIRINAQHREPNEADEARLRVWIADDVRPRMHHSRTWSAARTSPQPESEA